MANKLTVILDAEVDKFNADIKRSTDRIDLLKGQIQRLKQLKLVSPDDTKQQARLNGILNRTNVELSGQRLALGRAKTELKSYSASANQASASVGKLGKAQQQFRNQAGSSNAVALEFNRIIQDAPFGIIGVGNNIQQLAGNFSNLKAVSGGTGKAIAAALTSIVSPVNLVLLGISAVTSLWTAYSLGAFDSAETTEDLADKIARLVDSLSALEKAQINIAGSTKEEGIEADALFGVLNDLNNSEEIRLRAYNELLKKYPSVFEGISKEDALLGDLAGAYKEVSDAILLKARSQAFSDEISNGIKEERKLAQESAAINKDLNRLDDERLKARERLAKLNAEDAESARRGAPSSNTFEILSLTNSIDNNRNAYDKLTQSLIDNSDKAKINQGEVSDLADKYNALRPALLALNGSDGGSGNDEDPLTKKLKEQKATIEDLIKSYNEYRKLYDLPLVVQDIEIKLPDAPPQIDDPGRNAPYEDFTLKVRLLAEAYTQLTQKALEAGEAQLKLEENFQKLLESEALDLLEGGLRDFANSFVDSLNISNNALEGFVSQVIGAVPKIIGAFIKLSAAKKAKAAADLAADQASAVSGGVVIAVEAAKGLGPAGAIALPIILGGVLALIGGAFSKAGGGGGGGGGSAVAGNSGQSFTGGGLGFQGFGDLQLSSSIRGTDLVLLINRSGNVNN